MLMAATEQMLAERSVQALYARDRASRDLGIRIVSVAPGRVRVAMVVRADMLNGHRTCHGGMVFALADSALAFACNSHGEVTVAAGVSIEFLAPAREGDELTAEAVELHRSHRTGFYDVTVTNQRGERVAMFRGRSHRIGGAVAAEEHAR